MQKVVACNYKRSSSVPSWAVPTNRVGFSAFPLMNKGFGNLWKHFAGSVCCCLAVCIGALEADYSKSKGLVWNFVWFTCNKIQEVLSNLIVCGKCSQTALRCFRGTKEVVSYWKSWEVLITEMWVGLSSPVTADHKSFFLQPLGKAFLAWSSCIITPKTSHRC